MTAQAVPMIVDHPSDLEAVEGTLAAAVEEFNAAQDPQERARLIVLIRRLRGQLGISL